MPAILALVGGYGMSSRPKIELTPKERRMLDMLARVMNESVRYRNPLKTWEGCFGRELEGLPGLQWFPRAERLMKGNATQPLTKDLQINF